MTEFSPNIAIDVVNLLRLFGAAFIAYGGGYLIHLLHKSLKPSNRVPGKDKDTAFTVKKRRS